MIWYSQYDTHVSAHHTPTPRACDLLPAAQQSGLVLRACFTSHAHPLFFVLAEKKKEKIWGEMAVVVDRGCRSTGTGRNKQIAALPELAPPPRSSAAVLFALLFLPPSSSSPCLAWHVRLLRVDGDGTEQLGHDSTQLGRPRTLGRPPPARVRLGQPWLVLLLRVDRLEHSSTGAAAAGRQAGTLVDSRRITHTLAIAMYSPGWGKKKKRACEYT